MKLHQLVDIRRTRWLLARAGHRHRVELTFKTPAKRADLSTGRRRMVALVFRGAPELFARAA